MKTSELKEKIKHRLEEKFDLKKARCGCSTDVIVVHCKEDEETH